MAQHERLFPPGLLDSRQLAYSQAMCSRGATLVHVAGQAALDAHFNLVGPGDFAAQTDMCFRNLGIALAAAGARPGDVTSVRIYVVDLDDAHIPILKAALLSFFGAEHLPPGTLLGVARLAMAGLMIEIEATAVV